VQYKICVERMSPSVWMQRKKDLIFGATHGFVLVMKKLVSSEVRFDILYAGEKIYQNLSHEACLDIMQDLAERYYESPSEGKDMFDANLISMEECTNG